MVDVGHTKPEPVRPADSFIELKRNLDEPAQYFLGPSYESLILPDHDKEYYGFPPNKSYIFRESPHFRYEAKGFAPLTSFAAGGLAEAWTGGSYPLTDAELRAFPFAYRDIEPYYAEVTRRIGISGAVDDMARFFPVHADMLPPLDLDEHSKVLLAAYARRKESLNRELRCYIGRSRSAVLSVDWNGRKRCSYSGRCLWGCPSDSLYTPSVTLRECRAFPELRVRFRRLRKPLPLQRRRQDPQPGGLLIERRGKRNSGRHGGAGCRRPFFGQDFLAVDLPRFRRDRDPARPHG